MAHGTEALVVTCIDYRFQEFIEAWLARNLGKMNYDRVAIAGASKDIEYAMGQVNISVAKHSIQKVIFMNHLDCGMYSDDGDPTPHIASLGMAERRIEAAHSHLDVETYLIHLNGMFQQFSATSPRRQK